MDSKKWIAADGEYCRELPDCPSLVREEDCDALCQLYEKAPHPVFDGPAKEFRLRRCPACLREVPHAS